MTMPDVEKDNVGRLVAYDLNALADYHESSAEAITPAMLRALAAKYDTASSSTPESTAP
jgi:hypothetical protein